MFALSSELLDELELDELLEELELLELELELELDELELLELDDEEEELEEDDEDELELELELLDELLATLALSSSATGSDSSCGACQPSVVTGTSILAGSEL